MEPVLIKISGSLFDAPGRLDLLAASIMSYREQGKSVVITHGGGVQISRLSEKLGIPVKQIHGRRITDGETLEVLLYSVAGSLNTRLVHMLNRNGVPAVGLTGIDGGLTMAKRRPVQMVDGEAVDFGFVGDLESVNPAVINSLVGAGFTPVVACVTADPETPLNVNADTIANAIAMALRVSELVVLMDVPAVLDAAKQPVRSLTTKDFETGKKEGWISAGMIPKLETCFQSVRTGIKNVRLASPESLSAGGGTLLTD